MRILVTFAVEAEFAPWRKLRKFHHLSSERSEFYSSLADGNEAHELRILLTGIGRETCLDTLRSVSKTDAITPDVLVSSGFAGALKDDVVVGSVIAPARTHTLQDDADVTADAVVRSEAIRLGALPINTMITSNHLARTVEEKSRLAFYGEAVDMESALVMAWFKKAGAGVMALRVVSDAATEDLPVDFDRCLTPQGAIKTMSLVNQIVRRPGNLPDLVRFGRQSYQAGQALARFLEHFVEELPKVVRKVATV